MDRNLGRADRSPDVAAQPGYLSSAESSPGVSPPNYFSPTASAQRQDTIDMTGKTAENLSPYAGTAIPTGSGAASAFTPTGNGAGATGYTDPYSYGVMNPGITFAPQNNDPYAGRAYTKTDPAPPASTQQNRQAGTDVHCYGKSSEKYLQQLLEFINDEYRDYLYYNVLARKAPSGNARRVFRNIARDELAHARKFAAAYFLISGKRYMPTQATVEPVNVPSTYNQALRDRYLAEISDARKYRDFANAVDDSCLKALALRISEDEQQHAQLILEIIQTMR